MGFRVLTNLIKYKILVYTISRRGMGNIASTSILDTSPMTFPQNQMAVVLKQTKSISLC